MPDQTPAVGTERKLAAIFSTDVAGYSCLSGAVYDQVKSKLVSLLFFLLCVALQASTVVAQPESATSHQQGPTDPRELEAFLDPFFAEQMTRLHVPGAVFLLVKDGQIFFTKGYGFANLETKTPVVPDKTLFRVGSVSKLFTATAVMQLAERGLLNLDEDVNKYLTLFHLENTYPKPVTMANLLTHTGGFDERSIGMATRNAAEVKPLGPYLAARMPPRVLPPGEVTSYSNHGVALAGYVVEVVSGAPFAQYIEGNIFQPLGMQHSSFLLPPHLAPDLAVGYEYTNNTYRPVPFDYLNNVGPAGSLNATAADIAHFMIAHLQDGRYGETRILQEATAQEMHRQHFTHHPRLPGFAYGFYELFKNGQRAIMHDGGWRGFSSQLVLLPAHNLGFFVSSTTYNPLDVSLYVELLGRFFDHYYPMAKQSSAPSPGIDFRQRAARFTGSYRHNRYSRRSFEKGATMFEQFRVTASDDGVLTLHFPGDFIKPSRWMEVEPLLFQRVDGNDYLAFQEDQKGQISHLFFNLLGPSALEKLPWYETTIVQSSLSGVLLFVFFSACLVWPVGALLRRWRKQPSIPSELARLARFLAGLVSILSLVFLVSLNMASARIGWEFVYGTPPVVIALLCLPLITTLLTAFLPIFTILAWEHAYWSFTQRLYYSTVTLAALAYIPFLYYWNLLGFRF